MATTVRTYQFGPEPQLALADGGPLAGFDREAVDGDDYDTERARALYRALGAHPDDEDFVLGTLPGGRWALVGLIVEGHTFAVEER